MEKQRCVEKRLRRDLHFKGALLSVTFPSPSLPPQQKVQIHVVKVHAAEGQNRAQSPSPKAIPKAKKSKSTGYGICRKSKSNGRGLKGWIQGREGWNWPGKGSKKDKPNPIGNRPRKSILSSCGESLSLSLFCSHKAEYGR